MELGRYTTDLVQMLEDTEGAARNTAIMRGRWEQLAAQEDYAGASAQVARLTEQFAALTNRAVMIRQRLNLLLDDEWEALIS